MKKYLILIALLPLCMTSLGQVFVNSYGSTFVSKAGLFGSKKNTNQIILSPIDSVKRNMIAKDFYKSSEAVLVDLFPLFLSSKDTVDRSFVYKQKIVATNATSVSISFDELSLSENAILYLYNSEGTVVTGPIRANENVGSGKLNKAWRSNSFVGNSIILELKIPMYEVNQNKLHISKVYFGLPLEFNSSVNIRVDSAYIGHFNISSECNINMICPQGNDWQNERRAVCLIETEDGGNASGALMMNTCNTAKPYILTAWHVTEGRNTNNWTFLFGWWSSTCIPNTNVSQSILFNGAILRATFEPTDFSLIELNQTPTANLNLSFLGWNRQNNIPASTTGIHHPKGDQMKISFDTYPAAIGNVRLNSNTAWRVVWKSGITEKGSSGSPLFDQNHRVVGQNFSGTQPTYPPCNQQTGGNNYGRFDLSWTGGGTNSTRLSNWLDPNGIGALITNTTNISTLVSSTGGSLSILGDGNICSGTKTYTLNNNGVPYNGNVTWTSSNPNIASITPNSNPATLTRVNNGIVTITASVGCGINKTKEVNVNVPDINYSSFLVSGPSCLSGTGAMSFGVNYNGTSGCGLNNYNITEVEWQVFCSNPYQVTNNAGAYACSGINKAGIRVTFFQPIVQPFVITFLYRLKNSCGWSEWSTGNYHLIQPCTGSWSFTTSPNPTEGTITVALDEQTSQNKNVSMREVQVMDKFSKIVKRFEYGLGKKTATLNLNDLKADIYFIKVFDGKEWRVQSVIKN